MSQLLQRVKRELLDVIDSINQDKIHHDGDDFHELLRDIDIALAQPKPDLTEQQRESYQKGHNDGVAHHKQAVKAAQLEQEPVAWMCNAVDGDVCERSNHDDCEDPIPLYTTPPKRQPLTDDEINKCDMCGYVGKDKDSIGQCPKCRWDELRPLVEKARQKPLTDDQIYDMYNEPRSDAEMLEFARAIEAAHGIKEKNT